MIHSSVVIIDPAPRLRLLITFVLDLRAMFGAVPDPVTDPPPSDSGYHPGVIRS